MAGAQLGENAGYVTHAPMLGALPVFHPENIAGGKAKGATSRGDPEVGAAMRAGIDEASRHHVVGCHCRFHGNLQIGNAREPCREKANCGLFG